MSGSKAQWRVGARHSGGVIEVRQGDALIAEVFVRGADESRAELIASAPDLLAERDALRAELDAIRSTPIPTACDACKEDRDALPAVLRSYIAAYPAFRIKPIGARGSQARVEQELLMALEERAQKLLEGK